MPIPHKNVDEGSKPSRPTILENTMLLKIFSAITSTAVLFGIALVFIKLAIIIGFYVQVGAFPNDLMQFAYAMLMFFIGFIAILLMPLAVWVIFGGDFYD